MSIFKITLQNSNVFIFLNVKVLLYEGSIPADRVSERRSERATMGVYSVALSSHDATPGVYYISVHCDSSGGIEEKRRFRVAPLVMARDLVVGHVQ